MYCAHCANIISQLECCKLLTDFLSIPSRDIDLGQPKVTVLNALALVVGIRLLNIDQIILPESLCICASCEQLLQDLFLAHERFTNENSFIVKKYDWNGSESGNRVPVYKETSTQTDFTEDAPMHPIRMAPLSPGFCEDNNDTNYYVDFVKDEPEDPECKINIDTDHEQIAYQSPGVQEATPSCSFGGKLKETPEFTRRNTLRRRTVPDYSRSHQETDMVNCGSGKRKSKSTKKRTPMTKSIRSKPVNAANAQQLDCLGVPAPETCVHRRILRTKVQKNYKEVELESNHDTTNDNADDMMQDNVKDCDYNPGGGAENHVDNSFTIGEGQGQQITLTTGESTRFGAKARVKTAKTKQFHCKFPECAKKSFTSRGLIRHEIEIHGRPKMDPQQQKEKRRETAQRKPKNHHCSFDGCGKSFKSSHHLQRHGETHLSEEERNRLPWGTVLKCEAPNCGKTFRKTREYRYHQNVHLPPELKHVFPKRLKKYKCDEPGCYLAFSVPSQLKGHKLSHLPLHDRTRSYPCPTCGKLFTTANTRNAHKALHDEGKNCLCTECGNAFKNMRRLKEHMKSHSNERMYKCKECGKGFNQSKGLAIHVKAHTDERPEVCEVCGKGFKSRGNLAHHMILHNNPRQHKCPDPFCTGNFNRKHHLRKHLVGNKHKLDLKMVDRYLKEPGSSEKLFN